MELLKQARKPEAVERLAAPESLKLRGQNVVGAVTGAREPESFLEKKVFEHNSAREVYKVHFSLTEAVSFFMGGVSAFASGFFLRNHQFWFHLGKADSILNDLMPYHELDHVSVCIPQEIPVYPYLSMNFSMVSQWNRLHVFQAIASAADKIAELTKKEEVKEPVKKPVKEPVKEAAKVAVKDVAEKVAPKMEAKKEEKESKETKETKASRIHVHHIWLIGSCCVCVCVVFF